jgi:hypothetical protein
MLARDPRDRSTIHGNIIACGLRGHSPPAEVCRHDTIEHEYRFIRSKSVSCFDTGSLMTTLRILAVIYVVQAGVGVASGVAYAVWLLYW